MLPEAKGSRKRDDDDVPLDVPHDDSHRLGLILVPHLDQLGKLVSRVGDVELPRTVGASCEMTDRGD